MTRGPVGAPLRLLLLGAPRPVTTNRWKDDIAEAAQRLGWQVRHVPAADVDCGDVVTWAAQADLLLWARTIGHDPRGDIHGMLRRVEDMGVPTVGLHLDLYWGVRRREPEIGVHPWWTCQWVFTADGGPRDWAGRGVNHRWCPPAMGHRFFGRATPVDRFRHRVVFVGGVIDSVHGRHRVELLSWASQRYGDGFVHYGRRSGRQVWGAELSQLYASMFAAVGDSAPAPFYWSDRVPCTLGRAGLLAHPEVMGMREWGFSDEVMILFPRYDWGTLSAKIDAVDYPARRRMTDAALTLISERHMWTHRLLDIVETVFGG